MRKYKFKLIRTFTLLSMVRKGDFFTSIDLKDAFFHVPVARRHRKYLRFCLQGECYQYTCLPFGYKLPPSPSHAALSQRSVCRYKRAFVSLGIWMIC